MANALVEVEIPDSFEFIRVGVPKAGEQFLCQDSLGSCLGSLGTHSEARPYDVRVIVRPAWQWPAWLACDFIAQEMDGHWHGYAMRHQGHELAANIDGWDGWLTRWDLDYFASGRFLNFTPPPPCTDWRQSKRRNPNAAHARGEQVTT
jgi:hypothetical protein